MVGESASSQRLSHRFQAALFALQHPSDCRSAPLLILDSWYSTNASRPNGYGFGSHLHRRAIFLLYAVRFNRTLVEPERVQPWKSSFDLAWNDCVRSRGLGGCDVFRPASHCTLPHDWRALWQTEAADYEDRYGPPGGDWEQLSTRVEYYRHRRYLLWAEVQMGDPSEFHHSGQVPGWRRRELLQLPPRLSYVRHLPECWWSRQALAYHTRLTAPATSRLTRLVAASLQLPHPHLSARAAVAWADRHALHRNGTTHWWHVIQALKLEWQLQLLDPTLVTALRALHGLLDSRSSFPPPNTTSLTSRTALPRPLPLLGYTFIRHGDKVVEVALHGSEEYLGHMQDIAVGQGVTQWFVGSDDFLSVDDVRAQNAQSDEAARLSLSSSALEDSIPNKQDHPLARGFILGVAKANLSDEVREGIMWRTLVQMAAAQLADVHVSTWSSNTPRLMYELTTAWSEARATMPFVGLDDWHDLNRAVKAKAVPECARREASELCMSPLLLVGVTILCVIV